MALSVRALVTVTPGEGADPEEDNTPDKDNGTPDDGDNKSSASPGIWIGIGIAGAVIAAGIVIFVVITVKKKKS